MYDAWLATGAFLLALVAGAIVQMVERPLRTAMFWIRTLHALASFPYLLFKLPLLDTVLTHARKTGYDRLGHTVPFQKRSC